MRLRTLVLDADEAEREQISRVLRSHGHVVVAMSDADTAFEAHRRNPFDLIVVDWAVAKATPGADFCRRVRTLPGGDVVTLLVLRDKGGGSPSTDRIVAAGATDVLSKPVDEDALRTRVRLAERAASEMARLEDEAAERAKVRAQLVLADRLSSMGTLAAGVAHEVNNPLASLTASLDFVEESLGHIEDTEVTEALSDARRSAERVTEIVGALSRFARAERTEAAPVDVEGVLDTIAQVLSNEIRHRAQLVRDYGGVSAAMADEGRLGQVFLNLMKNAADALPIGHVDVHQVKLRTREDAGYVVVEVSDTGPGVDPRIASRIFDPFFTTKPIGSGTGLGLSLCHGVISGLGGTIELVQGTVRGATFRVRLPIAGNEHTGRGRRRTPSSPVSRPVIGGRVLVVDDERLIRRSIKRTLVGHDVTLAENGKEALGLCLRNDYDVILCDLMMPEVSGMELHDRLVQARPELIERIVYMTGGAFTSEARSFLDRIDNIQLSKPFEVKELRATIAELVAERRKR